MKKNIKLILSLASSAIAVTPFVAADMRAGPELLIIPIIGLTLIAGFIVGAIFLILWIIRTIKNKNAKKTQSKSRKRK